MIYLISSILISTLIFVIFRMFPNFKVDTLQAIVYNYFIAFIFGFVLFGNEFKSTAFDDLSWVPAVCASAVLFIGLFLVIGLSSQRNGVALTSVSIKMSMAMSMLLLILWHGESITIEKITGIVLAIAGVLLMSIGKSEEKTGQKPLLILLLLLFIGGGLLDFTLNYVQHNCVHIIPNSLFSAVGFALAGMIGLCILITGFIRKKRVFHVRNLLAGLILGIPNFFSIYLLMQSYEVLPWADSTILAITNVSIVIVSAFIGFILFKERFSWLKALGLAASLAAILLLYYANLP